MSTLTSKKIRILNGTTSTLPIRSKNDLEKLGFRRIQNHHEREFQLFFKRFREESCYSNSWLYITQAARGLGELGYYYTIDDKFIVALGRYHNHYVLINPTGEIPPKFVHIIETLCELSGHPVFIKKASKEKGKKLRRYTKKTKLKSLRTDFYPWKSHEENDDDTFPEIIIDIEKILRLVFENKKLETCAESKITKYVRNIKFRLKRCEDIISKIEYLRVSEVDKNKLIEMLRHHFQKDAHFAEAYKNMIERLHEKANHKYIDFVAIYNGKLVGFFAAEILGKESAGLYASIALKEFKGLSEALHIEIFKMLRKRGIRYLNLGGSEIKSLYEFKLKLACHDKKFYSTRNLPIIVIKRKT